MYDIEEYSHIRILHILLLIGIGVGLTIIVFLPDHTPPRRAQNFIHCRMARGLQKLQSQAKGKAREAAKGKKTEQAKVTAVAALVLQCKICKVQLNNTKSAKVLQLHVDSKHPKNSLKDCFPDFKDESAAPAATKSATSAPKKPVAKANNDDDGDDDDDDDDDDEDAEAEGEEAAAPAAAAESTK